MVFKKPQRSGNKLSKLNRWAVVVKGGLMGQSAISVLCAGAMELDAPARKALRIRRYTFGAYPPNAVGIASMMPRFFWNHTLEAGL
jgi:hypothetical protein